MREIRRVQQTLAPYQRVRVPAGKDTARHPRIGILVSAVSCPSTLASSASLSRIEPGVDIHGAIGKQEGVDHWIAKYQEAIIDPFWRCASCENPLPDRVNICLDTGIVNYKTLLLKRAIQRISFIEKTQVAL